MEKLCRSGILVGVFALLAFNSAALADTLTLKSGTHVPVVILDTAGAQLTAIEHGFAVTMSKQILESYIFHGIRHQLSEEHSVAEQERAEPPEAPYRDPEGYTQGYLTQRISSLSTMAFVGGVILAGGITMFIVGTSTTDSDGFISADGFRTMTLGIPLISGGATMLGVGLGKAGQYRNRLSRLNLSAQLGHDAGGFRLSYNF